MVAVSEGSLVALKKASITCLYSSVVNFVLFTEVGPRRGYSVALCEKSLFQK